MPEQQHEYRPHERGGEFARLSEFAQRGSVLQAPERIRTRGAQRIRRRRAGQVALGTGAFAVVTGLGASLALQHGSGHGSGPASISAGAGSSVAGARPSASAGSARGTASPSTGLFGSAPSVGDPLVGGLPPSVTTPSVSVGPPNASVAPPSKGTPITFTRDATNFNMTFTGTNGYPDIYALGITSSQVLSVLHQLDFGQVGVRSVPSTTVAAGDVVDIDGPQRASVLGHSIPMGTALTLVVSAGPAS